MRELQHNPRYVTQGSGFVKVKKSAFYKININIPDIPSEIGGIMGSHNNDLIDEIVIDKPDQANARMCSYYPNVDFFNQVIEGWQKNNICFMGIFHTHFFGVTSLSSGDKKYIDAIMKSMPSYIECLYFPIFVLPNRELVCYKAQKRNGTVDVCKEDVYIED